MPSIRKRVNQVRLNNSNMKIAPKWLNDRKIKAVTKSINKDYDQYSSPCQKFDIDCGIDLLKMYNEDMKYINSMERLEVFDRHLASLRSVVENLVNLLMNQPLESQDDKEYNTICDFLTSNNIEGESNYDTLLKGFAHALIYGRCGFRFLSLKDGIIFYPANQYTLVYEENKNHKACYDVLGYIVSRNDRPTTFGSSFKISEQTFTLDLINDYGFNDDYLFLKSHSFYNFYFFGDQRHPDTPLNHDVDRINMFLILIKKMLEAINTSNSDVQLVHLAEDLFSMNTKSISDIVASSKVGTQAQEELISSQAKNFAKAVSKVTNQSTMVTPPIVKDFETLGAKVQVKDFLTLYDHIEVFISKLYGMSNNVLNLEKMPRDASSNPIFEQMMKTSIYPKRSVVLRFMNTFLRDKLKVSNIKFREESYANGVRLQNAQALANIVATLSGAEIKLNEEDVKNHIEKLIFN